MNVVINDANKEDSLGKIPYEVPTTRYVGSKRRYLELIYDVTKNSVSKDSVILDLFGGSGVVSYLFKKQGARIIYNDYLKFNWWIGKALIENSGRELKESDVESLLEEKETRNYPTFIRTTFRNYYYTDDENRWLDIVSGNIRHLRKESKKAAAYYALFQSCLIKRPWSLFNRMNLSFRLAEVQRNFNNKTTWDTSFETMFRRFCDEINQVAFNNNHEHIVLNKNAEDLSFDLMEQKPTLVYIDPPSGRTQSGLLDYLRLYHFLEGLANYPKWHELIDYESNNSRLKSRRNSWNDPAELKSAWKKCIQSFKDTTIVVSYRSPGFPKLSWIKEVLKSQKQNVEVYTQNGLSRIVTSTNQNPEINEHILIAE